MLQGLVFDFAFTSALAVAPHATTWTFYWVYIRVIYTPIMENQMEKKMENEMETAIDIGLYKLPNS